MRWLILSDHRPASLHALLESAVEYLPRAVPIIIDNLVGAGESMIEAYGLLSRRFHAHWLMDRADFRDTVLDAVEITRQDGSMEPMVLLTTDTVLFIARPALSQAWAAMQQFDVLGVSLTAQPSRFTRPLYGLHRPGVGQMTTWDWTAQQGDRQWGQGFAYGGLYRPGDILGPLCRNEAWSNPDSLRATLAGDDGLRRRNRMACFAQSSLVETAPGDILASGATGDVLSPGVTGDTRDCDPTLQAIRYLQGEIIDRTALAEGRWEWRRYEEPT